MAPLRRRRLIFRRVRVRRRYGVGLAGLFALFGIGLLIAALAKAGGGSGTPAPAPTASAPLAAATIPSSTAAVAASPSPASTLSLPAIHPDPARLQPAEVVDVIDGDTIDVRLGGREERVRYFGIDTPERGDACFYEARERNRELVARSVLLLPDARERDRYGRLLRYVFDQGGASVDERLIAEGLARAWRQDGAYRDQMVALEGQAQAAGVGCLWSTATP